MIQTRLLSQHDQNISTSYKRATSKVNQAGDFRIERLFSIASKNENHHQVNISFKVVRKRSMVCFCVEITLSLHLWYLCLHSFADAHSCRHRYHSCRDRVISTLKHTITLFSSCCLIRQGVM